MKISQEEHRALTDEICSLKATISRQSVDAAIEATKKAVMEGEVASLKGQIKANSSSARKQRKEKLEECYKLAIKMADPTAAASIAVIVTV